MAVTHADLAPSRPSTELGSKAGTVLIIICIICGLFCFILCLIAEATRSIVTWESSGEGKQATRECMYSGSGKTPLMCAGGAFLGLAAVMVVEHSYMLVAVSKSTPPVLLTWDPDSSSAKALTWQAGFFFFSTWISFAVGEILLLIGVSVESGHLRNWSTPKPSCLTIPQGLFSAAGVFGLATTFLATGLYLTAVRAQKMCREQETVRRQVLDISVLFASPPLSPRHRTIRAAMAAENPTLRLNDSGRQSPSQFSSVFAKVSIDQV